MSEETQEVLDTLNDQPKPASEATRRVYERAAAELGITPEEENEELELARRNCLLSLDDLHLEDEEGEVVWDARALAFLRERAQGQPVNPSLWLNGKANIIAGVFEVVDGIYQVRGIDIANLTIVRSKTGWIVQDCMTSTDSAHAALLLLERALGEPVRGRIRAVIISHSHGDHFGGVLGVVSPDEAGPAEEGKIPVIVPAGFDEEAIKENVYAGPAMHRRSAYQFGGAAGTGEHGSVSTGLGNPGVTLRHRGYLAPTTFVDHDGERVVDGVPIVFQLTPDTEAPAEMSSLYPSYRAFWSAETATATLHNLYPIRGAKLRDAANWWRFTQEALERFAGRFDVVFQSHHWPHPNTPEHPHAAEEFLLNTAAAYKYVHDQTLLLANEGHTAREIGREIRLPEVLQHVWYTRPYYGAVPFNARAVYNKYLGFYNGNPVNLDPLTEVEEARAFVDYAGGADAILARAASDLAEGAYRQASWAAEQVVYADPSNRTARLLAADAFEQLGYQAESSIWRNAYLAGAADLRHGTPKSPAPSVTGRLSGNAAFLRGMPTQALLDYLGIFTDKAKLEDVRDRFVLRVGGSATFAPSAFVVTLYAGLVLYAEVGEADAGRDEPGLPVVELSREALVGLAQGSLAEADSSGQEEPEVRAEAAQLVTLRAVADAIVDLTPSRNFPLVEPRA